MPVVEGQEADTRVGAPDKAIRTDLPHHPEIWADVCGWYSLPGPLTDVRARGMIGAGFEVFVRRGQLHLRCLSPALYKGLPLHPDDPNDPYAFRIELAGFDLTLQVVFSQEAGMGTTAVHLDVMPLSARKQQGMANPRRWVAGALAAGTNAIPIHRRRRPAA